MTVVFRDSKLRKIKSYVSAACVADFESHLAGLMNGGVVFLDFHLPILNDQQIKRQKKYLEKRKKKESERSKDGWGHFSKTTDILRNLLSGEVNITEGLNTEEARNAWIGDVRSLYNFYPYISYVHPKGKFVRFDFRKVSGFVMFAIITSLRYYTENPQLVSSMYKIKEEYKWDFKKAFIFTHLLSLYSPGHSLLDVEFDFEKTLAFSGFKTNKTLALEVLKKSCPLREGTTLKETFSYCGSKNRERRHLKEALLFLKENSLSFEVIKKEAAKLGSFDIINKLTGEINSAS